MQTNIPKLRRTKLKTLPYNKTSCLSLTAGYQRPSRRYFVLLAMRGVCFYRGPWLWSEGLVEELLLAYASEGLGGATPQNTDPKLPSSSTSSSQLDYSEGYSLNAASEYANDSRLLYLTTLALLFIQHLTTTSQSQLHRGDYFAYCSASYATNYSFRKSYKLLTVTKAPMAHRQWSQEQYFLTTWVRVMSIRLLFTAQRQVLFGLYTQGSTLPNRRERLVLLKQLASLTSNFKLDYSLSLWLPNLSQLSV